MPDVMEITRAELKNQKIDLEGRDIVIGFSEPAFRDDLEKVGALLNARLLSYFLPAVEIARMQTSKRRPRLVIVSGIKAALKWNARDDQERITMLINNNLKKEFLSEVFQRFFPEVFSIVEIRDTVDFLKIPDTILRETWSVLRDRYPEEITEIETHLQRFRPDADSPELLYQYALIHLFGLGDVNLDWEPHGSIGYCSIGEHNESIFNEVRILSLSVLKEIMAREGRNNTYFFENQKIVITDEEKVPPPYNGAHRGSHGNSEIDEVTFENERNLSYYEARPRLLPSMKYIYSLIPESDYVQFWVNYKEIYLARKARYLEAYSK